MSLSLQKTELRCIRASLFCVFLTDCRYVYDGAAARWVPASGWPRSSISFTNPVTSSVVSVTGIRGLTGMTDYATNQFTLYASSSATGNNYLLKYNTVTDTWSYLWQAARGYDIRAVAIAPHTPPTPSSTPSPSATRTNSATPTVTPSVTASLTQGGSPTSSPSITASVSSTGTATRTPSATGTRTPQACAPDAALLAGRPLAAAGTSFLAVRLGTGTAPLTTGAPYYTNFFIDEVDAASGARLQSIAVSPNPALGGCVAQVGPNNNANNNTYLFFFHCLWFHECVVRCVLLWGSRYMM